MRARECQVNKPAGMLLILLDPFLPRPPAPERTDCRVVGPLSHSPPETEERTGDAVTDAGRGIPRTVAAMLMAWMWAATSAGAEVYRLELADVLPGGKALKLMLDVKEGRVVNAFGLGRRYNGRGHGVDASGLTVADDRIAGPVTVTVMPDPWVPKDHKERTCKLALDVT